MKKQKRKSKKSQLIGLLNQLQLISKMGIKFNCYQCGEFQHGYGFNIWVPDWCMSCIVKVGNANGDGNVISFYTDDEKDAVLRRIRKGDWPKLKGDENEEKPKKEKE